MTQSRRFQSTSYCAARVHGQLDTAPPGACAGRCDCEQECKTPRILLPPSAAADATVEARSSFVLSPLSWRSCHACPCFALAFVQPLAVSSFLLAVRPPVEPTFRSWGFEQWPSISRRFPASHSSPLRVWLSRPCLLLSRYLHGVILPGSSADLGFRPWLPGS